jgi:hypothetical protein
MAINGGNGTRLGRDSVDCSVVSVYYCAAAVKHSSSQMYASGATRCIEITSNDICFAAGFRSARVGATWRGAQVHERKGGRDTRKESDGEEEHIYKKLEASP